MQMINVSEALAMIGMSEEDYLSDWEIASEKFRIGCADLGIYYYGAPRETFFSGLYAAKADAVECEAQYFCAEDLS